MNNNGEKHEVSEPKLEQVSGGTSKLMALYRCPVCNREQVLTFGHVPPEECLCPCGAHMKRVNVTITKIAD